MAVGIGRSMREGFRAANKSWAGIGVVIGVWIILAIVGLVGIGLTNPPAGLGEQARSPVADITPPPPATTTAVTPAPDEKTNLFKDMETVKEAAPAPPATTVAPQTAAPPTAETAANATQNREEQIRAVREWVGRAWPILLIGVLLGLAVSTWLAGAQIGYLAARVRTQQSSLSQFWAAGARAFWPLLGVLFLMLVAVGGLALIMGWGIAALGAAIPGWLLAILLVILWIALVWVAIRLAFWLIAIVVDRTGPVGGLRASLRATRGRWWQLFGLILLLILISIGVRFPFGLLEGLGRLAGGAAMLATQLVGGVVGGVANVYLSFMFMAACIRFYEDAKGETLNTSVSV